MTDIPASTRRDIAGVPPSPDGDMSAADRRGVAGLPVMGAAEDVGPLNTEEKRRRVAGIPARPDGAISAADRRGLAGLPHYPGEILFPVWTFVTLRQTRT